MFKVNTFIFLTILVMFVCFSGYSQEKPIVAVLDFSVEGVSDGEMTSIISLLSSALFQTKTYTLIDTSQRSAILSELEFSSSGCTDESCMLEIGKLLSAEFIVIGNIGRVGSRYVMNVKMLETETSKTINTADGVYKDLDELLDGVFGIADQLAETHMVQAEDTEETEEIKTDVDTAEIEKTEITEETEIITDTEVTENNSDPEQEIVASDADVETSLQSEKPALDIRRIGAFGTAALGVGGLSIGAVMLYKSLSLLLPLAEAKAAFESDVYNVNLYNDLTARNQEALDGEANNKLIIGVVFGGVGIISSGISILLFLPQDSSETGPKSALITTRMGFNKLTFNLSY